MFLNNIFNLRKYLALNEKQSWSYASGLIKYLRCVTAVPECDEIK